MFGYLLFGCTALVYLVLCIFVMQAAPSGSDQTYGWANSAFFLILAYTLCSLLLTINVALQGGFHWISDSATKRNIVLALLWFGLVAGVTYCTVGRIDYQKFYQLPGSLRLLSNILFYGAAWLPLLMLIPYLLFLKPEWRESLSPNLFKFTLGLAFLISVLLVASPNMIKGFLSKSFKKFDEQELEVNKAMLNIAGYRDVMSLLYYTSEDYDGPIRNAALAKIKAHKHLEDELIEVLERGSASTCYDAYAFLVENKPNHPERFVEPIAKSFTNITADMYEGIVSPYHGVVDLEVLLRLLEEQCKDSKEVFRPHMLKLQDVLKTPPAKSRAYGDVKECNETLDKNRKGVRDWLAN